MATSPQRPANLKSLTDAASASMWNAMNQHDDAWGVRSSDWDVNQAEETILFTNRDNGSQQLAPVQIVATHEIETGLWRWGWDHPSVLPGLRRHAATVRDLGGMWGFPQLSLTRIFCSEAQAWQLVAVAFELNPDASGACRTPTGEVHVYTTFGDPVPV